MVRVERGWDDYEGEILGGVDEAHECVRQLAAVFWLGELFGAPAELERRRGLCPTTLRPSFHPVPGMCADDRLPCPGGRLWSPALQPLSGLLFRWP